MYFNCYSSVIIMTNINYMQKTSTSKQYNIISQWWNLHLGLQQFTNAHIYIFYIISEKSFNNKNNNKKSMLHLSFSTLIELPNFRYKINLHLQNIDNASKLNHSIHKLTGFSAFTKVNDQFQINVYFQIHIHTYL